MTQMKTNITGILHRDDKGQRPISTPVTSLSTIGFFCGFFIGSAKNINVIEPRLTTVHL